MLKVLVILILFALVSAAKKTKNNRPNRRCNYATLDKYLAPIIGAYGLKEVQLPANRTELQQYCRSQANADQLAKEFSKTCMNGLVARVVTSTLTHNRILSEQSCGNSQSRLMSISRCVRLGKTSGKANKCWTTLIDNINRIKRLNNKLRIPLFCCNYYEWRQCTLNVYEEIGSPACHREVIGNIEQRITSGLIQPLKELCTDYEADSKKCSVLLRQMPKTRTNKRLTRSRPKTAYLPLIEIFDSL